jgi:hypothetical protein
MNQTSKPTPIFVFASTEAESEWTGRAKIALEHYGASMDVTQGFCGQSYAICTHNRFGKPFSEEIVNQQIQSFRQFTLDHPEMEFCIAHIGSMRAICGNCKHREYRGPRPASKEVLGNCPFEPNGYWFGPNYDCTNHQHRFTAAPMPDPSPIAMGWSDSGSTQKAARPVDTPI